MKFDKNLIIGTGVGIIVGLYPAVVSCIMILLALATPAPVIKRDLLIIIIITLFLLIGTPIINSYYPIYAPCLLGFCIISFLFGRFILS